MAKKSSIATCNMCLSASVDGTSERSRLRKISTTDRREPMYTEKQLAFAAHPRVTLNARQAALDAGYSETFARKQAAALRKQLAPLIMDYQERAKMRSAISAARIQTELACMGFANVLDYFHISANGKTRPKQLDELTREQAAAIQEVEVIDYNDLDTGETFFVIGKLKLADKRQNLVELGKTIGLFNKLTIEDKRASKLLLDEVPTKALADAEKLLLDAVAAGRSAIAKNEAIPGEYTQIEGPKNEQTETEE